MCVNYIHYFPKVNLEVCKSSVDSETLINYFKFMNKYVVASSQNEQWYCVVLRIACIA